MASTELDEIIRRAEKLSPEEQLTLVAHLVGKARQAVQDTPPRRRWQEIRGAAPYPLLGQDAQAWISRSRGEDEELRVLVLDELQLQAGPAPAPDEP